MVPMPGRRTWRADSVGARRVRQARAQQAMWGQDGRGRGGEREVNKGNADEPDADERERETGKGVVGTAGTWEGKGTREQRGREELKYSLEEATEAHRDSQARERDGAGWTKDQTTRGRPEAGDTGNAGEGKSDAEDAGDARRT
ncbi:uncharacterized protein BXZ73DRAFT_74786 [Epithele typhae]|uniref:uncharacterized protein n=1 Tax=Epithele typhae TaxID=378194 RepID=UPI0020086B93|nr:uncharacterized protein BXZ73DRAFT_74786 [Epithele typhae]KAH9942544.1 hypothetical protein BXZ73DRAFT_74786 [Epithele typhae]